MAKIKAQNPQSAGTYGGSVAGDGPADAAATEDSTGEAVPMPCCMNAQARTRAQGERHRQRDPHPPASELREKEMFFTMGKNSGGQSGDGKSYEPAPQRGAETP